MFEGSFRRTYARHRTSVMIRYDQPYLDDCRKRSMIENEYHDYTWIENKSDSPDVLLTCRVGT